MSYIPVVDFSPLLSKKNGQNPSEQDWVGVQKEIYKALSEVGFVYIINHGIDQEMVEQSFAESKTFFELPMENKLKYKTEYLLTGGNNHGYCQPNQQKLHPSSKYEIRETFDVSNIMNTNNIHGLQETPNIQKTLLKLKNECTQFAINMLKLLARAVEEDEDYFMNRTRSILDGTVSTCSTFRSLYYPKVPNDLKIEPGFVRCGEHTDYGTFTILFQDEIGGLEVKTVHNTWVPANPIPGSVLVNTGDLLEFWSGGRFPATAHRVLIPESELRKQIPRQSIAYFIHPDDAAIVSPLPSAKSQDFEPISAYDHAKNRLDSSYRY